MFLTAPVAAPGGRLDDMFPGSWSSVQQLEFDKKKDRCVSQSCRGGSVGLLQNKRTRKRRGVKQMEKCRGAAGGCRLSESPRYVLLSRDFHSGCSGMGLQSIPLQRNRPRLPETPPSRAAAPGGGCDGLQGGREVGWSEPLSHHAALDVHMAYKICRRNILQHLPYPVVMTTTNLCLANTIKRKV